MADQNASTLDEWKRHWPLAAAATIGLTYSPMGTYSLGLFMDPLSKEFGWSRSEISSGLIVLSVFAVILSSPVGAVIDRFGARKVAIPGMLAGIAAIGALSFANGSLVQWLFLWVGYALASLFIKTTVWCAAVSKAFSASRGLALGVVLCGIGISQTLTPIIAQQLIDGFGWRQAYQLLAVGWGGLVLFLLLLFFHDVQDSGGRPKAQAAKEKPATAQLPGYSFREAMRTRPVLQICGAVLICSLINVGVAVHLVPILVEGGLGRTEGAAVAGLGGLSAIGGKLLTGVLIDRFRGSIIPFTSFALPAVGMAILLMKIPSVSATALAALILGYAAGATTQSTAYLVTRYAGLRAYGAVYGIMSSLIGLTLGFGPWFAGKIFDLTGSYQLVLTIGVPCTILAGILLIGLGPYPDFRRTGSEEA